MTSQPAFLGSALYAGTAGAGSTSGGTNGGSAGGGGLTGRGVYGGIVPVVVFCVDGIPPDGDCDGGFGARIAPAVSIVLRCDPLAGAVSAAPQCTQKRVPAWLSLPQITQFIDNSFGLFGREACRKKSAAARFVRHSTRRALMRDQRAGESESSFDSLFRSSWRSSIRRASSSPPAGGVADSRRLGLRCHTSVGSTSTSVRTAA